MPHATAPGTVPGIPATKVIGSYLSPYVRKVLVCLDLKGVPYEIDPIVPYFGNDEFEQLSPLRRVPVLIDDNGAMTDSTVICEYLEERYSTPSLMPQTTALRAKARWLEEFADARMGEVFIWHLYNQVVIKKYVWGQAPDQEVLQKAQEIEIPQVLNYLERELPDSGLFFGNVTTADVAIASFFRNAFYAGFSWIDAGNKDGQTLWPKTADYVASVLNLKSFKKLQPWEVLSLKTPIAKHAAALKAEGAPVSAVSFGEEAPRAGIVST